MLQRRGASYLCYPTDKRKHTLAYSGNTQVAPLGSCSEHTDKAGHLSPFLQRGKLRLTEDQGAGEVYSQGLLEMKEGEAVPEKRSDSCDPTGEGSMAELRTQQWQKSAASSHVQFQTGHSLHTTV